jgi:GH24 family phage-related lysozyme (muramidase)
MRKLIVILPENRDFEGVLRLEEQNGRLVAGPFAVCGRADGEVAGRHGNSSRQALLPFGDTPLGRYRIAGILPTGRRTNLPAERFGPYGVVVLQPAAGEAALADANGRFCIVIQGGKLGPGRRLRPTNGSLRLADKDQKKLVRALRRCDQCVCECMATAEPVTGRPVARDASYEEADPPLGGALLSQAVMAGTSSSSASGRLSHEPGQPRRFGPPSFHLSADSGGGGGGAGGGGGYDSGTSFSSVDTSYINQNEGFRTDVYADTVGVPTVGYGVNLSAQTVQSLQDAGVPQSIVDQVEPLLGMSAAEFAAWSKDNTLTLSDPDAQTLSTDIQKQYFDATGQAYDNKTSLGVSFSDLPTGAQTAICDLWYNMGPLSSKAPDFWNQVTTGQWQDAINNLTQDFSKDPRLDERAKAAGQLLQDALKAGTLPQPKK